MPGDPAPPPRRPDPFASETRLRELVEHLPVVVYIDSDDRLPSVLYLSPKVEEILGHPPEAYLADRELWRRSMHEEDRSRVRELKDRSWREGAPFRAEFRMRRPDGREVWIRDSCVLVRGERGERLAWQGVLEDITAEKRSDQDIRSSEARYRALVERVPAVVYEMGPDDERRTLFVSPHVEEVLGYSRAEWLDQPDIWIELLHEDDREVVLARHDLHSETGEPWDLEYRLIASDGRVVWVHDRGTLIRDPDGHAAAWHGVMIDVTAEHEAREMLLLTKEDLERRVAERTTELAEANELMTLEIGERRRMEGELLQARRRYQRLVEHLPGVAYVWEIHAGSTDRTFTYVSPGIEDMVGFTPEGWRASARVHPHDRDAVAKAIAWSERTGGPFEMEYRSLAKDGRVVWVLDKAVLLARNDDGSPSSFQGVMLDITARKEAESKAEEAEDRFRSLTEDGPVVVYAYEARYGDDGTPTSVSVPYISPQIADLIGFPLDRWRDEPMKWFDMVHPDDRERVERQMDHYMRTGEPWAIRYRMIRSDGRVIWLHDTGRTIERDGEGRPWRFQGVLLDVTAEQETAARIASAEAGPRAVLDGAKVVPWTEAIDPVSASERYTYIGPQALEVFGYTPEELMVEREHFTRMVHPDDLAAMRAALARADRTGVWEGEYRVFRRDGRIRWIHSIGRRASGPGVTPEIWHGVAIDVTAARTGADDRTREVPASEGGGR